MSEQTQLILKELQTRYKKSTLSKSDMANELGVSSSTIDKYMKHGLGVPNYKKLGSARNAKIVFNIIDVAEFLSQTIKVA